MRVEGGVPVPEVVGAGVGADTNAGLEGFKLQPARRTDSATIDGIDIRNLALIGLLLSRDLAV